MAECLNDLLAQRSAAEFATAVGTDMHTMLQRVFIDSGSECGNIELIQHIKSHSELLPFFAARSRTEVPVAGFINGNFVSRRIDRLVVDNDAHIVRILDYKTDTDAQTRRAHYCHQIGEYCDLLREIYPDYKIQGFILWTHNWTLERIK